MRNAIMMFVLLLTLTVSSLFLTGCKKEDMTIVKSSENIYEDQLLRFTKKIRVYDSEEKYWMDFEISSNAHEGIENTLLMKPTFDVLNTTYEDLQKDIPLDQASAPQSDEKTLQVVIRISDTNIPSDVPYKTKFEMSQDEMEKSSAITHTISYSDYEWKNLTQ